MPRKKFKFQVRKSAFIEPVLQMSYHKAYKGEFKIMFNHVMFGDICDWMVQNYGEPSRSKCWRVPYLNKSYNCIFVKSEKIVANVMMRWA